MELLRKFIYHMTAAIFMAILALLGASVVMRYFFNDSIIWAEEVIRFGFIWMFFLAMGEVTRGGSHLALDLLPSLLSGLPRRILDVFVEIANISFLCILAWYSWKVALINMGQKSPALLIPYGYIYMAIPVGCAVMVLFDLQRIHGFLTAPISPAPAGKEAA